MIEHKHNVGLLESLALPAIRFLQEHSYIFEPEINKENLAKISGIITRGKGQVDEQLINQCPNLKVIARCGVGLNNIDVDFASSKKIAVINAPGSNADTVAEHTIALILASVRRIPELNQEVKQGNWEFRTQYQGDEVRRKKLGIVGFGNIGQKVAHIANALQMQVSFWNRSQIASEYPQISMSKLLSESDIITLHLPINSDTHHIIDRAAIDALQPHCLIVNTGRGKLIDQAYLEAVLMKDRIGGFAADVLSEQPPSDNSVLLNHPRVILTPHAASLTTLTFLEMSRLTASNVIDYLAGKPIDDKCIYNKSFL